MPAMTTPEIEELPAWVASYRSLRPAWMELGRPEDVEVMGYDLHDGPRPVVSVRVVATEVLGPGPSGSQVPMAHFRIFLVLDEGNPASVEIDSRGTLVMGETKLLVSSHKWIVSKSKSRRKLSDKPIPSVPGRVRTVDDILKFLIVKGRHRYKLHSSGSGCRYWTKVVLGDLVKFGVLAPGSDNIVEAMEAEIAHAHPNILMLPNIKGEFR